MALLQVVALSVVALADLWILLGFHVLICKVEITVMFPSLHREFW